MTLGEKLKLKRKEKKLTQKQVAEKLGIDNTTVSKWESDTYEPDTASLKRLAEIFNTTTDYLTGHTEDPSENLGKGPINIAYLGGRKEVLTEDEAEAVEAALEIHRRLRAKRMKEKEQN